MEAPECQNFPSCGKRHFGECGTTQGKAARPKKKSKLDTVPVRPELRAVPPESDLMGRVVILEAMVMELLEARKKRSIYMKNYMREYRERGG